MDHLGWIASSTRSRTSIYRACRIDKDREQRWNVYAISVLAFSAVGILLLYLIQRIQHGLPFNPTDMVNVQPALAFNTAVSFVTNTNWQSYGGENTLSHLTQMLGLTVQNFVSAAAGIAVMVAFIRGLSAPASARSATSGSTSCAPPCASCCRSRSSARSCLLACGVIQNTHGFTTAHTVAGSTQQIPGGPVASQISIKQLGTNGGGFFNVNSTHPFEGGTKLGDFFELYAILIIPFSLAFTFGRMIKDKRQGYAVVSVMAMLWLASRDRDPDPRVGRQPEARTPTA